MAADPDSVARDIVYTLGDDTLMADVGVLFLEGGGNCALSEKEYCLLAGGAHTALLIDNMDWMAVFRAVLDGARVSADYQLISSLKEYGVQVRPRVRDDIMYTHSPQYFLYTAVCMYVDHDAALAVADGLRMMVVMDRRRMGRASAVCGFLLYQRGYFRGDGLRKLYAAVRKYVALYPENTDMKAFRDCICLATQHVDGNRYRCDPAHLASLWRNYETK
jgi:hypothetical protein